MKWWNVLFGFWMFSVAVAAQSSGNDEAHHLVDDGIRKNMVEFGGAMDFVSGNLGHWDAGRVKYTRTADKYTWFLEANVYNRSKSGGSAVAPVAGLYVDWRENCYTFTSLSTSTDTWYTPKFRIDQDVNCKFGDKRQYVGVLGVSYIDYHTPQSTFITSAGAVYYGSGFIVSYRLFYNICYPGALHSTAHILGLDQGHWYKYMNTFVVSGGKQAYMATYLESPEAINRNSVSVYAKHRYWFNNRWGYWAQVGYTNVTSAYHSIGFNVGLFCHL